MMSKQSLLKLSKEKDYKPEILEKVQKLLLILDQSMSMEYLRTRLALKGGTALNLFHFDPIPRLSVDIDLNYIGSTDKDKMQSERPEIEDAISKILTQNQFEIDRKPNGYAGGKSIWRYDSALGQKGNLEIDLNFMYREPLWPIVEMSPLIHFNESFKVPVLDIHELAAGKLTALFARHVSRDFFDAHYLLTQCEYDVERLRISFLIYVGMSDISYENMLINNISYNTTDIRNKLLPVLRQAAVPRKPREIEVWASQMLSELREKLGLLLPFKEHEIKFLASLRKDGVIKPELITTEERLRKVILTHPLMKRWRK